MKLNRILDIRERKELTQQELANIVGGSRTIISRWENKKDTPNIIRINKLANELNYSLDYIFNLTNMENYNDIVNKDINKVLVGERIKELRIKNNLKNRELARILNTSSSTISAYETGKTLLLTAFAIEICKKYNVSMDWLYGKRNNYKL